MSFAIAVSMTMCLGCAPQQDELLLIVVFPNQAVIEPGSPVQLNGKAVGMVGQITLEGERQVVELLLNHGTTIRHSMLPVASGLTSVDGVKPTIVFEPMSEDDLSLIYADDLELIESPYLDGEFILHGSIRDPMP